MTHLPRLMSAVLNKPHYITPDAGMAVLNALMRGKLDGASLAAPQANRFVGEEQVERDDRGYARRYKGYRLSGSVGIVNVIGELVNRGAWLGASSGLVSYEGLDHQLRQAHADRQVSAILLDMNTPGGDASGMTELAATVREIAKEKPVVALCNALMASAGYGIASAATRIVTVPSGVVGSIGVVWLHADYSEALAADGIKVTLIHEGAHKVDGNPFEPLPSSVRDDIQATCAKYYAAFIDCVAAGRPGLTAKQIRATEARCYLGQEAVDAGLADAVGTFESVLADLNSGAIGLDRPMRAPARAISDPVPVASSTTDAPRGSAAASDQPEPRKDQTMATDKTHTQADVDGARAEGMKAGADAERARVSAILGSDEAKGRADMAAHLAFKTSMAADEARAMLAVAPKNEPAPAVETKPVQTVAGLELAAPTPAPSSKSAAAAASVNATDVYAARRAAASK